MSGTDENKKYKKGQIVFREGEIGSVMYDIRWGSVGVYASYGTPDEKLLTTLYAGEYFGELGLVDALPRSATVVVLESGTQLREITLDGFSEYFKNQPSKIIGIMEHMSLRLRHLTQDYLEACKTISDYLDADSLSEARKNETLLSKMRKFAGIYKESKK